MQFELAAEVCRDAGMNLGSMCACVMEDSVRGRPGRRHAMGWRRHDWWVGFCANGTRSGRGSYSGRYGLRRVGDRK